MRQRSGRQRMLLLALIFFAPMLAAWLLYFVWPQWRPVGTTNHGELVQPARPLPPLALRDAEGAAVAEVRGKWTLIYLGGPICDETCLTRLHLSRQVRAALNEKRVRVQRVYIAPDDAALKAAQRTLLEAHPDLRFLSENGGRLREFFGGNATDFFLVDPLGNWLMTYAPEVPAAGLFKDLKKLLRNSQIG